MRGKIKTLLAVGLGLLLIAATAVSAAAQTNPPAQATPPAGVNPFGGPVGPGWMGWGGHMHGYGMYGLTTVADLLDTTVADITAELQKGRTLVQIAADKGVSKEQLVDALLAPHVQHLDALVAAGRLTNEQKQLMLDNMKARISAAVENDAAGPLGGYGCGMMGGWNRGTAAPTQGTAFRGGHMGAGMMGGFGPAFSRN